MLGALRNGWRCLGEPRLQRGGPSQRLRVLVNLNEIGLGNRCRLRVADKPELVGSGRISLLQVHQWDERDRECRWCRPCWHVHHSHFRELRRQRCPPRPKLQARLVALRGARLGAPCRPKGGSGSSMRARLLPEISGRASVFIRSQRPNPLPYRFSARLAGSGALPEY